MPTLTPYREKLLRILTEEGPLEDHAGLVVGKLRERTGHRTTQALSGVIKAMEDEGLVRRDHAGRRTYRLEATDKGASLLGHQLLIDAPADIVEGLSDLAEVSERLAAAADHIDYDRLAAALLKEALGALTTKAKAETDANLGRKYLQSMRECDDAKARVADLEVQLSARSNELLDARSQIKILEKNLKTVAVQADKPRRGADTVAEKISAKERRELASLMRSLPTTKG